MHLPAQTSWFPKMLWGGSTHFFLPLPTLQLWCTVTPQRLQPLTSPHAFCTTCSTDGYLKCRCHIELSCLADTKNYCRSLSTTAAGSEVLQSQLGSIIWGREWGQLPSPATPGVPSIPAMGRMPCRGGPAPTRAPATPIFAPIQSAQEVFTRAACHHLGYETGFTMQ